MMKLRMREGSKVEKNPGVQLERGSHRVGLGAEIKVNEPPNPDLESLIALYLRRCRVEGKSPHTIRAYGDMLRWFSRIAANKGPHKTCGR